ncbi:MAG: rRNA pseudouridine synthase [Oscillospiraceae bacterium]|nr:rRNA pseudouridine synthase [Oscillospiraceae bacterium]
MRLDKYLNDILNLGRKDLHRIIKAGRVTVNGEVQSSPDHKISEDSDVVCMDGEKIMYRKYFYYMMNKPDGYITAMDDRRQATIAELLPKAVLDQNVFPVGRLDKDTTGLIFLTSDGQFAHRLISPKYSVEKVYHVGFQGDLLDDAETLFQQGIHLDDGTVCLPAKLERVDENKCIVTVTEGKYHQVKRMIAAVGGTVISLHRQEIGGISLDPALDRGEIRQLTDNELCILMTLF